MAGNGLTVTQRRQIQDLHTAELGKRLCRIKKWVMAYESRIANDYPEFIEAVKKELE